MITGSLLCMDLKVFGALGMYIGMDYDHGRRRAGQREDFTARCSLQKHVRTRLLLSVQGFYILNALV